MTQTDSATQPAVAKSPSSTAQKVTAVATVFIALVIAAGIAFGGLMLYGTIRGFDRMAASVSDTTTPRAVQQAICLPYSDFVLRQRQAGIPVPQIQGVLDYAGHDGEGDAIDSAELCGSPQSILDAAGIK